MERLAVPFPQNSIEQLFMFIKRLVEFLLGLRNCVRSFAMLTKSAGAYLESMI